MQTHSLQVQALPSCLPASCPPQPRAEHQHFHARAQVFPCCCVRGPRAEHSCADLVLQTLICVQGVLPSLCHLPAFDPMTAPTVPPCQVPSRPVPASSTVLKAFDSNTPAVRLRIFNRRQPARAAGYSPKLGDTRAASGLRVRWGGWVVSVTASRRKPGHTANNARLSREQASKSLDQDMLICRLPLTPHSP